MSKVYIINGKRSYIGVENGIYKNIPAEILGAEVLKSLVGTGSAEGTGSVEGTGSAIGTRVCVEDIECIVAGNAVGGGGNIARLMMLEAGLPEIIPAFTVDMQCGSSIECISILANKIRLGEVDLGICGGFESSSTAPRRAYNQNHPGFESYIQGNKNNSKVNIDYVTHTYNVAKFTPGIHSETAMIEGAENVAKAEGFTREQLNKWPIRSHQLAYEAQQQSNLKKFITPITGNRFINNRDRPIKERDEGIRKNMGDRLLDRLPPIIEEGILTAGTTCLTHDAASFLVLCSEKYLKEHNITPIAEIIGASLVGTDPKMSPKSAITAIDKLLSKYNLTEANIDIFEINEAFAVIPALFEKYYPDSISKYNILGGALAYGHPYGASGSIITLHAIAALNKVKGKYAVCSVAAAGGIGSALLIKKGTGPNS